MKTQSITPLPDINEVKPLSEEDQPLVDELVAVLEKHNALGRFGITLLHQHFSIKEDEVLLETTDRKKRTQLIRPVKMEDVESLDYTETSWRLDTGEAAMRCICLVQGGEHTGTHQHAP